MKTMTCQQLGGACDQEFHGETWEEMQQLSQQHGMEMFDQQDQAHLTAMNKMRELMQDQQAMQAWTEEKRKEFENIPEN